MRIAEFYITTVATFVGASLEWQNSYVQNLLVFDELG